MVAVTRYQSSSKGEVRAVSRGGGRKKEVTACVKAILHSANRSSNADPSDPYSAKALLHSANRSSSADPSDFHLARAPRRRYASPGTAARRISSYPQGNDTCPFLPTPASRILRDPLKIGSPPPQLSPGPLAESFTLRSASGRLSSAPLTAPTMVATPRGKGTGTRIHSVSSGPAGARAVPACVSPLVDLLFKSRSVETLTIFRRYSVATGDFV